jgi:uncharacterized protein YndB with AHSA1/START domain
MTDTTHAAIEGSLHVVDGLGVVRMQCRFETGIDDVWSALTDPERLVRWYGMVGGDLNAGGGFTATVIGSGWDGRGRIELCVPPRKLQVTQWEEEGSVATVTAELATDGDATILVIESRGISVDLLWAFGCGWQTDAEDLGAHLAGQEHSDWPSGWGRRFDELTPFYREMAVVPLDPATPRGGRVGSGESGLGADDERART